MGTGEDPAGQGGVFVARQSDVRIRSLNLELGEPSFVTEIRTHSWKHWLAIAAEAADKATLAREAVMSAADDDALAPALEREFRDAMTGLCAATFAIDAFYAAVVEYAPDTRVDEGPWDAQVFETLERAFRMTTEQREALRAPLHQMYTARHEAVHPPAQFREPVTHPVLGVEMEPRFVIFTAESAAKAHSHAHRLIWLCLHEPRAEHELLAHWTRDALGLMEAPDGGELGP